MNNNKNTKTLTALELTVGTTITSPFDGALETITIVYRHPTRVTVHTTESVMTFLNEAVLTVNN